MKTQVSNQEIDALQKYVRATNFLSVAQIYLQNVPKKGESLGEKDIKPRLLGHWGTCPGINFVAAHINRLICKHNANFLYVVGPGHGFPAMQANLFVEGSLSHFYPKKIPYSQEGIEEICRNFSAPHGYPSHSNPEAPGAILEGGELGYSLSVSFGSVLDNPELITCCLVGDGESETGPLAAAWHVNKVLSPKENGAVLPIVHVNGYKISGPTFLGRMSNEEVKNLFTGLGYKPYFVEKTEDSPEDEVYEKMAETMDNAYSDIRTIQKKARSGEDVEKPEWPVIILRTPKGWSGIKEGDGEKYEGNCLSHQVIFPDMKKNENHRKMLEDWVNSYNFWDLVTEKNGTFHFVPEIESLIPPKGLAMGMQKYSQGGEILQPLILPELEKLEKKFFSPGEKNSENMTQAGEYFREILVKNKGKENFRIFSPDETYSNKIDAVFKETKRSWQWPIKEFDTDMAREGKVIEMLSEHTLFGLLHGYSVTGRHGVFVSYEAFVQVVASMADQYAKFIKASEGVHFRKPLPPLNIFLTSLLERQDHNGFSHQNPSFLSSMLEKDGNIISAYLPPDSNSMLVTLEEIFTSRNALNMIVAGKKPLPLWLTLEQARKQMDEGIMIWDFCSDENPNVVIAASGDYVVKEAIAALSLVKEAFPTLKVRMVCVSELTALGLGDADEEHNNAFLDQFFTPDKGVVFVFHGYPHTIKKLLYDYSGNSRITVHGYLEEGSTTTPFDMETRNRTSRYHLAIDLAEKAFLQKNLSKIDFEDFKEKIEQKLTAHKYYILENGIDPEEIENWKFEKMKF